MDIVKFIVVILICFKTFCKARHEISHGIIIAESKQPELTCDCGILNKHVTQNITVNIPSYLHRIDNGTLQSRCHANCIMGPLSLRGISTKLFYLTKKKNIDKYDINVRFLHPVAKWVDVSYDYKNISNECCDKSRRDACVYRILSDLKNISRKLTRIEGKARAANDSNAESSEDRRKPSRKRGKGRVSGKKIHLKISRSGRTKRKVDAQTWSKLGIRRVKCDHENKNADFDSYIKQQSGSKDPTKITEASEENTEEEVLYTCEQWKESGDMLKLRETKVLSKLDEKLNVFPDDHKYGDNDENYESFAKQKNLEKKNKIGVIKIEESNEKNKDFHSGNADLVKPEEDSTSYRSDNDEEYEYEEEDLDDDYSESGDNADNEDFNKNKKVYSEIFITNRLDDFRTKDKKEDEIKKCEIRRKLEKEMSEQKCIRDKIKLYDEKFLLLIRHLQAPKNDKESGSLINLHIRELITFKSNFERSLQEMKKVKREILALLNEKTVYKPKKNKHPNSLQGIKNHTKEVPKSTPLERSTVIVPTRRIVENERSLDSVPHIDQTTSTRKPENSISSSIFSTNIKRHKITKPHEIRIPNNVSITCDGGKCKISGRNVIKNGFRQYENLCIINGQVKHISDNMLNDPICYLLRYYQNMRNKYERQKMENYKVQDY